MEVVRIFNNELSSLYEVKPPISKAKMTQITKSAIKGIKFYKHIVQSVEKFIQKDCQRQDYRRQRCSPPLNFSRNQKNMVPIVGAGERLAQVCRPEYKVPGLYVVDSIVRQSRHQFGADKDVFGPRFVKNINNTFQHLFKCNPDDRPKIIRVLNLWQKNAVFPIDVIQPLLDMGHPNSSTDWPNEIQTEIKESPLKSHPAYDERNKESQNWKGWPQASEEQPALPEPRIYAEMSTKNLEKFMKSEMSNAIKEERYKMEREENTVKFNKKLLDFDYGDEDEEDIPKNEDNLQNTPNALALSISQNLLSNPDLLRQLQQLSSIQQQQQTTSMDVEIPHSEDFPSEGPTSSPLQPPLPAYEAPYMPPDDRHQPPPQDLDERSLTAIVAPHRPPGVYHGIQSEGDKDDRIIPDPPPRDLDERSLSAILTPIELSILPPPLPYNSEGIPYQNQQALMDLDQQDMKGDEDERIMYSMPGEPPLPPQDFDERALLLPDEERKRDRSRSRSRGRSGRHNRSRSKSPRRKRSQSRSRKSSRSEGRERIHEKERERERERERRKKGLPPIKKGSVSVCSTTLWLGHVPKSCTESDISAVFGEFGTILSIDMIPPRGCAFVVMDRRQDANKAVLKLKNLKLHSSLVKLAWAPGKGVKGKEYKEYWDVNAGVSYVPHEKIPEGSSESLDLLEEGGFIDEESLPDNLKELRSETKDNKMSSTAVAAALPTTAVPPPPPIIPPVNLSGMVHLMQPQFGLPLPGLLPPQAMVMQVPMGIPPPNPMLMVQQQSQAILNPIGMPPMIPRAVPPVPNASLQNFKNGDAVSPSGDATPTEEDGTINSPISNAVSSAQQSNPVSQFNAILGLQNRPMLPPVSSAGAPIPYPPPTLGFSFPPPGIRPPQFPWLQQKPFIPDKVKQDEVEKKSDDMEISGSRSSPSHDMVISTDDESSMDRDYPPRNDPRFQGPTEFPHHPRGGLVRFPRGFPPRMGGPRGMHPNHQHMEFAPHPRMPRREMPIDGRDWYPRDYDHFERGFDKAWGEPDRFDCEENFNERRNYRNENRSMAEVKQKTVESKDKQKSNSKRNSKSLMDDMFKLRFYQRDKNPSYASHLSKKLETKKKETVTTKSSETTMTTTTDSGRSKRSSRWGRTLSEEREIQDQKRFEIEIKFQSYEQSSKALQAEQKEESSNTPVVDTPVADTPVVDTPVVDTPVVDTPVVDTPVVDTPVVDTPVMDTSVASGCDEPLTNTVNSETIDNTNAAPSES